MNSEHTESLTKEVTKNTEKLSPALNSTYNALQEADDGFLFRSKAVFQNITCNFSFDDSEALLPNQRYYYNSEYIHGITEFLKKAYTFYFVNESEKSFQIESNIDASQSVTKYADSKEVFKTFYSQITRSDFKEKEIPFRFDRNLFNSIEQANSNPIRFFNGEGNAKWKKTFQPAKDENYLQTAKRKFVEPLALLIQYLALVQDGVRLNRITVALEDNDFILDSNRSYYDFFVFSEEYKENFWNALKPLINNKQGEFFPPKSRLTEGEKKPYLYATDIAWIIYYALRTQYAKEDDGKIIDEEEDKKIYNIRRFGREEGEEKGKARNSLKAKDSEAEKEKLARQEEEYRKITAYYGRRTIDYFNLLKYYADRDDDPNLFCCDALGRIYYYGETFFNIKTPVEIKSDFRKSYKYYSRCVHSDNPETFKNAFWSMGYITLFKTNVIPRDGSDSDQNDTSGSDQKELSAPASMPGSNDYIFTFPSEEKRFEVASEYFIKCGDQYPPALNSLSYINFCKAFDIFFSTKHEDRSTRARYETIKIRDIDYKQYVETGKEEFIKKTAKDFLFEAIDYAYRSSEDCWIYAYNRLASFWLNPKYEFIHKMILNDPDFKETGFYQKYIANDKVLQKEIFSNYSKKDAADDDDNRISVTDCRNICRYVSEQLLIKSAEFSNPWALDRLACLYIEGDIFPKTGRISKAERTEKAIRYFYQAANLDNLWAHYHLAKFVYSDPDNGNMEKYTAEIAKALQTTDPDLINELHNYLNEEKETFSQWAAFTLAMHYYSEGMAAPDNKKKFVEALSKAMQTDDPKLKEKIYDFIRINKE